MSTSDKSDRQAPPPPGPNTRPTLKTIAYMTGLGVTTVSRALHDAPDIGQATKQRVRAVADQIGYRPNRAGVRLRTGKNNAIAMILSIESEGLGANSYLIYGASEYLTGTPYNLTVAPYQLHHDPLDPVRYVVETGSVDGIIMSRTEPQDNRVRYLEELGFPYVTHGRTELGIVHPYVDFDNGRYAELAVDRLAARGRRRIALIGPPMFLTFARQMTNGFIRGIERHDLTAVPVRDVDIDSPYEAIQEAVARLMAAQRSADGFVCGNAASALAVIAGAEAVGRAIGRDFDVVVKESFDIMRKFHPSITSVHEDFRGAGRRLAEYLIRRIDGAPPEELHWLDEPEIWQG